MMLGGIILVVGTLLASTATSLWGLVLTYGIPFGTGMGITYAAPIAEAIKWVPWNKGLFTGIIVAGFGAGAFVFGQIAMAVVNPEEENVNQDTDYFDPESAIPGRVPTMFLVLGCCYSVLYCISIALIVEKPTHLKTHLPLSATDGDDGCVNTDQEHADPLLVKMMSNDRDTDNQYTGPVDSDTTNNSDTNDETLASRSYAPNELYCSPLLWHVALCFVCTSAGGMYLAGTFKMYGEGYIESEGFLTLVAETAAIFNAVGRIFWGYMADRTSTVTTLQVLTAIFATVIITFSNLGVELKEPGFALWSYALFFCEGGYFSLYMPLTVQIFGVEYSSSNYGLVFTIYSCFVVLNIIILTQGVNVQFATATLIIGCLTYTGLLALILLEKHMAEFKNDNISQRPDCS